MTVRHEAQSEAQSDGIHTVSEMAEAQQYTVHTEADHQGNPDIRNKTYLLLPQATGARRNHDRRMQRAAIQTEWGGSEDERVDQVLRALRDPRAKELIVAYEADRQDTTALQTYRMDCLTAPLCISWPAMSGAYTSLTNSQYASGPQNTIPWSTTYNPSPSWPSTWTTP